MYRRERCSYTWRWCWTCSAGASWAGPWRHTCGPNWCSRRSTWRCGNANPKEVIYPSDQGCQYTSLAFSRRCKETGVRPSMGSVADCFDNAMAESFFVTLECELLDRSTFRRAPRRSAPSSSSSRVGTFRIVGIRRRAICRQSTSSGSIPSTRAGFRPQMWNCPLKRGNCSSRFDPRIKELIRF